jgi:hypothetical protein
LRPTAEASASFLDRKVLVCSCKIVSVSIPVNVSFDPVASASFCYCFEKTKTWLGSSNSKDAKKAA